MDELRLKEYRRMAKMTQQEVAEMLNITQSGYSLWELGKRLPDSKQIIKLCEIFKCSPNDLFGFRGVHAVSAEEIRS